MFDQVPGVAANEDTPPKVAIKKVYDYDVDGNLIYEGWASPGALTSAAVWSIRRNTFSSSTLTLSQWADGDVEPNNIWDNRAGLTYA